MGTSSGAQPVPTTPDASSWQVPGRIEVFGKHTDYCGGRSLVAAVEQSVTVTGRRVTGLDDAVRVTTSFASSPVLLRPGGSQPRGHWAAYPQSVLNRLTANFGPLGGAELVVDSTLPPSSGMSSSSALVVGIASVLVDLAALADDERWRSCIHSPLDRAGYFATMENGCSFGALAGERGVGTFGGSQDHTAMLGVADGCLGQFQFAPTVAERQVVLPDDVCFVVAVSGVLAEKTGAALAAYNAVSLRAGEVLRRAQSVNPGFVTLRDAVRGDVALVRRLVADDTTLTTRLEQFVVESEELVPAAAQAVASGDWSGLREAAATSQRLATIWLGNQVPQTVALVDQAVSLGALGGASAFGAGFGGSVWALVPTADAAAFADEWRRRYVSSFPDYAEQAQFLATPAAGPARRVG